MGSVLAAAKAALSLTGVGGVFAAILVILTFNAWFTSLSFYVNLLVDGGTNILVVGLVGTIILRLWRFHREQMATKDAEIAALRATLAAQPKIGTANAPVGMGTFTKRLGFGKPTGA